MNVLPYPINIETEKIKKKLILEYPSFNGSSERFKWKRYLWCPHINAIIHITRKSKVRNFAHLVFANKNIASSQITMNDLKVITLKNVLLLLLSLLQVTGGVRSPNLQVVITHASYSYVCRQHSFGLPLRMYGMHRTHFDHARLDVLSLVTWSRVFWPTVTWKVRKAQRWSKSVLTFDRCNPSSLTFGY